MGLVHQHRVIARRRLSCLGDRGLPRQIFSLPSRRPDRVNQRPRVRFFPILVDRSVMFSSADGAIFLPHCFLDDRLLHVDRMCEATSSGRFTQLTEARVAFATVWQKRGEGEKRKRRRRKQAIKRKRCSPMRRGPVWLRMTFRGS